MEQRRIDPLQHRRHIGDAVAPQHLGAPGRAGDQQIVFARDLRRIGQPRVLEEHDCDGAAPGLAAQAGPGGTREPVAERMQHGAVEVRPQLRHGVALQAQMIGVDQLLRDRPQRQRIHAGQAFEVHRAQRKRRRSGNAGPVAQQVQPVNPPAEQGRDSPFEIKRFLHHVRSGRRHMAMPRDGPELVNAL